MNVFFKYLLIQIIFTNVYNNVYSTELSNNQSDISQSVIFINGYMCDTTSSISDSLISQQQNINNIYKPSITDYIQNKYKDRIRIIDEKKYVSLTIEEICECVNLYNKYINTKQKIDNFNCKLNLISQEITSLESEVKLKKNNNIDDSEFLNEYITNSLKNTIDYQVNLKKLISSVIDKLNNFNKSLTKNITRININEYLKIANKLLQNNKNEPKIIYENYIDKFRREIDFSYANNGEYNFSDNLKSFRIAHNNLIKLLNNNLVNINNKVNNIVDNITQEMKQDNYFIFTVNKYNCRKNYLINEINILKSDFKNSYDVMTNWEVNFPLSIDVNSCKKILIDKLESYNKRLINNPLSKLKQIFQKDIIFNCNNKENIEKFQSKIDEINSIIIHLE